MSPPGGAPLRSVEEARTQVLEAIPGPTGTETVALGDALWRVTAEAVTGGLRRALAIHAVLLKGP